VQQPEAEPKASGSQHDVRVIVAKTPNVPAEPMPPERPTFVPDVLLGAAAMTPQYGVLGRFGSQSVAIDLTGCNTISLFGVQGFGKSYTLGVIAEMASAQNAGVNVLPSPLATVIFHFHKSDAYEPEYVTAVEPNRKTSEVDRLLAEYGARPKGLDDVLLLAPEAKVESRRREYPGVTVEPIKFSSAELGAESWKFLLGAYGNDSLYIRQLVAIMRKHREGLNLETFRQEIKDAELPKAAQRLAEDRLTLAAPYIDDSQRLGQLLRPGRTVIVDLRDEWIEKDEALGLFVVMLRIFAASRFEGREFNKLVVFDEAHKYISESDLISQVVETIREMRHQATSVIIASQDPLSVPRAIIELTSVLILHRMTSPQWLKHLRSAIVALNDVQDGAVTSLLPGEALVWAQRSTDKRFTFRPQKVAIRPRFTQHGGGTKTAVDGATIR
jgi:DNA helicase HerA-like ATPase